MNGSINLSLKAGERIFINGAVLQVDRRVTIELLNDATFLLEGHVLQIEDAKTPLRQLYFVAQAILMDPAHSEAALQMFGQLHTAIEITYRNGPMAPGLKRVSDQVKAGRVFEALKALRSMFPTEDARKESVEGCSVRPSADAA